MLDFTQSIFFVHTSVYNESVQSDFGAYMYDIPTGKTIPLLEHGNESVYVLALSPERNKVAVHYHDIEKQTSSIYILALEKAF